MNLKSVVIAFFAIFFQSNAGEIVIRIKPDSSNSRDTYIRDNDSNYPNSSTIRISNKEGGSSSRREGFISFPGLFDLPSNISEAYLLLHCTRLVNDGKSYANLNVREPKKNWDATSINWSNKPSSSSKFYRRVYRSDVHDWVVMDISSLFSSLVRSQRGFHLTVGSGEAVSFTSSDNDEWEDRPEVSVIVPFPDLVNPVAKWSNGKWVRQSFPGESKITSDFGEPWDGNGDGKVDRSVLGYRLLHTGIDLRADAYNSILAIHDGTVYNVGQMSANFGWRVSIRYSLGNGKYITTSYLHLNRPLVVNGATVTAGQPIGTVWDLARFGFGNHLHLQMRYGSENYMPSGTYTDIVTIGRLPETQDDTKQINGRKTGVLPSFPEFFIDLSRDVKWSSQ